MKKSLKRILFVAIILILTYSATSCNLPIKNRSNDQNTPAPLAATTPPPPDSSLSVEAIESTPESEVTPDFSFLMPVTGSILRWVDASDFVFVPKGEYTMGEDSTSPSDHAPAHKVSLAGFWIQQAEVTNQQYAACVADGVCTPPAQEQDTPFWYSKSNKSDFPVVGVTWVQATEYCAFIEGRLPTEAEWEATARGSMSDLYPWGDDKPSCSLLNYDNCLDPSEPEAVRSYNNGASEFEAMDMSGNVFEWVNDWYADDYYTSESASNPVGPGDGTKKVFRGGGYASNMDEINPAARFSADPNDHASDLGFRCVLTGFDANGLKESGAAPSCKVLPVVIHPNQEVTITPIPCQPPSIQAPCTLLPNGKPWVSITIHQTGCDINRLVLFESNSIADLSCSGEQDSGYYVCQGSNLAQGATYDLSFRHDYNPPKELISDYNDCPPGYEFNELSLFCEPTGDWLPEPPCPPSYLDVYGRCWPDYTAHKGCPEGFKMNSLLVGPNQEWSMVCVPVIECLWKNAPESCNMVCPEGETYDTAKQCCSKSEKLVQLCPFGLEKQAYLDHMVCDAKRLSVLDETRTFTIGICPTLTPTPTTPPANDGGGNPGQNCYCDPAYIGPCVIICD